MKIVKIRNFCLGLILSVIGLWSGLFDYATQKVVLCRDFIVGDIAQAFVLPKVKIPIVLARSQSLMRGYFNKFKNFGRAVWSICGFTHNLAVNTNASLSF